MKAFEIFYYAPCDVVVDDVFIAETKLEAAKNFIIKNKGRYNVAFVTEFTKPDKNMVESVKDLLNRTLQVSAEMYKWTHTC